LLGLCLLKNKVKKTTKLHLQTQLLSNDFYIFIFNVCIRIKNMITFGSSAGFYNLIYSLLAVARALLGGC